MAVIIDGIYTNKENPSTICRVMDVDPVHCMVGLEYLDEGFYGTRIPLDIRYFMEAYTFTGKRAEDCPDCGGYGLVSDYLSDAPAICTEDCTRCDGRGWVY